MSKSYLPFFSAGPIIKGFSRGSKELGIPTGKLTQYSNEFLKLLQ